MKNLLVVCAILLGVETLAFGSPKNLDSTCQGYDSQSHSWVYGDCMNGYFTGRDSQTGAMITGSCMEHGTFSAYNSATHSFVYGNCM